MKLKSIIWRHGLQKEFNDCEWQTMNEVERWGLHNQSAFLNSSLQSCHSQVKSQWVCVINLNKINREVLRFRAMSNCLNRITTNVCLWLFRQYIVLLLVIISCRTAHYIHVEHDAHVGTRLPVASPTEHRVISESHHAEELVAHVQLVVVEQAFVPQGGVRPRRSRRHGTAADRKWAWRPDTWFIVVRRRLGRRRRRRPLPLELFVVLQQLFKDRRTKTVAVIFVHQTGHCHVFYRCRWIVCSHITDTQLKQQSVGRLVIWGVNRAAGLSNSMGFTSLRKHVSQTGLGFLIFLIVWVVCLILFDPLYATLQDILIFY